MRARPVQRIYREIPNARELRILIDNDLRWAKLYRGQGLEQSADEKLQALKARGWQTDDG